MEAASSHNWPRDFQFGWMGDWRVTGTNGELRMVSCGRIGPFMLEGGDTFKWKLTEYH